MVIWAEGLDRGEADQRPAPMTGTLLGPLKGFQDMIHHHCLVPELIIQGSPNNPVVILPVLHHHKVDPLEEHVIEVKQANFNGAPYLLIQWVMSPLPGLHVEMSILLGDTMPHVAFKDTAIDKRHGC